ncbi:pepSY domain protein [Rhodovulum sulfidophilum]|uniref:PepSY domain protein n=1 Tax=Rhodovulum sulfidophilum TaxID=35806 RepID=A0A0D6B307_RHOSU|nr:pepSY domain protein [Rhodovulum sulfidophilum]
MVERLLSIPEAARALGVPKESLRRAADTHGKTIRMGRAVRLHPDDLEELIELCRVDPQVLAFTGGKGATVNPSGKSETRAASESRPARAAAQMLKRSSRPISSEKTGRLARLPQMS